MATLRAQRRDKQEIVGQGVLNLCDERRKHSIVLLYNLKAVNKDAALGT